MESRAVSETGPDKNLRPEPQTGSSDDEQLLLANLDLIQAGLFGCNNPLQLESSVGFARFLSQVGINASNHLLFLRLLETNNKWIVDALIGAREPHLLFSGTRPHTLLVRKAFELLSFWHPGQIYPKVLQAVLGIVEYAFYNPDDGYRIYKLRITDLNNIGKFLDEEEDQFEPCNELLLAVLDRLTRMGAYDGNLRKSVLAKHAFDIRIAFFDHRKRCLDIIPQLLLVRIERENGEVKPFPVYQSYLESITKPDKRQSEQ